jgi:CTP-dependent riboflavin kinase
MKAARDSAINRMLGFSPYPHFLNIICAVSFYLLFSLYSILG